MQVFREKDMIKVRYFWVILHEKTANKKIGI